MAVKNYPEISAPDGEDWEIRYNTQSFTSKLNGVAQTVELPGAKWAASVSYGSRFGREARILQGFLASLKGTAGRFWFTPTDWEPLGNPSGTGLTAALAPGGSSSIETDGWPGNSDELFIPGDYIELSGELKKVTNFVNSDIAGAATIEFAPPLRRVISNNTVIRYNEPRCLMKLADDSQASWSISSPVFYGLSLDYIEAIDI